MRYYVTATVDDNIRKGVIYDNINHAYLIYRTLSLDVYSLVCLYDINGKLLAYRSKIFNIINSCETDLINAIGIEYYNDLILGIKAGAVSRLQPKQPEPEPEPEQIKISLIDFSVS